MQRYNSHCLQLFQSVFQKNNKKGLAVEDPLSRTALYLNLFSQRKGRQRKKGVNQSTARILLRKLPINTSLNLADKEWQVNRRPTKKVGKQILHGVAVRRRHTDILTIRTQHPLCRSLRTVSLSCSVREVSPPPPFHRYTKVI
ncbi:hypothetical protein J6590_022251 [Homalodisca vitripennis]|nr:hypothetical protein J6590_022251 [Homalodisca vitripennis]